jgi:anti-sigma factor RsiW
LIKWKIFSISFHVERIAMDSCQIISKKLSAYQDGEVTMAEQAAIETHLRTCEACRTKHEALLLTYQILRNLPEIEPAPELSRQIVNNATQVQEPFWVRVLGSAFRSLPASAAMAILAAAGLLIGAITGNFLTERQFHPSRVFSTLHSDQALTLASVQVFDATPPGSFAEGYLKLTAYNPETDHEK